MTALLALAVVAAGVSLVVGARETAKKICLGVLGAIVGLGLARCLACWLAGKPEWSPDPDSSTSWFWILIVVFASAGAGALAWKTRALRRDRKAERRRMSMHPRRPAPPSAPNASHDSDGFFP